MISVRDAYNEAAEKYRRKYDAIPARTNDVDAAFALVSKSNPKVAEVGCAYGREAKYILTKTNQYIGIDICDKYIEMAKNEVLGGKFEYVDVLDYRLESGVDIIFSFASLLHLSKEDLSRVLEKMNDALALGGVIFLSLKHRDKYYSEDVTDVVSRTFYYYNLDTIKEILPPGLKVVHYQEQILKEKWFTIILQN